LCLNINLKVGNQSFIKVAVGKKISLGYKHLAPGSGKCGKKEWSLFGRFQRSLEKTFKLKIQSRGWPLILQKGSTTKNISVGGINVLLLVIGARSAS
jgi:hypothetical protein